jgi:hypothetical protein
MSPRRLTYEQKFEKFVVSNLEKMFEKRENPEEIKQTFDLMILDNETSLNARAKAIRENEWNEKL